MPDVFRGMLKDNITNQPQTGNDSGNKLGVRPDEVVTYPHQGVPWVAPMNNGHPQGMSVTPNDGCDLPAHRRPKNSNWNGTGSASLKIWRVASAALPANLQYLPDPGNAKHGFVAPAADIVFSEYQANVQLTAPLWIEVAPPQQPCTNAAFRTTGANVMAAPSLTRKIAHALTARSSADLVKHVLDENKNGASESEIVAAIEGEIVRLEAISSDDDVELLRAILDRITGFCGEHLRLRLK